MNCFANAKFQTINILLVYNSMNSSPNGYIRSISHCLLHLNEIYFISFIKDVGVENSLTWKDLKDLKIVQPILMIFSLHWDSLE